MDDRRASREEMAKAEIGRTEVGRGTALALITCFSLTLLGVPLADRLRSDPPSPWRTLASALPEALDLLGSTGALAADRRLLAAMDELERSLERGSTVATTLQPPLQRLLTGWLGAGNEQVYPGVEGWLFLRPGVDHLTGPGFLDPRQLERRRRGSKTWEEPPQPDPIPAILELHRQLGAWGVPLLVMPVPTKAALHPRQLSPGSRSPPPLENPSMDYFRHRLETAGVTVFDPAPGMAEAAGRGELQYLRTDTHWRPLAVERAAEALALAVEEMIGPPEHRSVYRRRSVEVRNRGDLAVLLRLSDRFGWRGHDASEAVVIHPVIDLGGQPWQRQPNADVLLLGDSFSNVYSQADLGWGTGAGLGEQLSFALGRPLDRIAVNGGGADAVRRRFADTFQGAVADGRAEATSRRLVIYQFAARELSVGDWVPVSLPEPGASRVP